VRAGGCASLFEEAREKAAVGRKSWREEGAVGATALLAGRGFLVELELLRLEEVAADAALFAPALGLGVDARARSTPSPSPCNRCVIHHALTPLSPRFATALPCSPTAGRARHRVCFASLAACANTGDHSSSLPRLRWPGRRGALLVRGR